MSIALAETAILDLSDLVDVPPFVSVTTSLMGGTVGVHLLPADDGPDTDADARRAAQSVLRRLSAWAERLTRFTTTSDLARLNDSPAVRVPVSPTLAAALKRLVSRSSEPDPRSS